MITEYKTHVILEKQETELVHFVEALLDYRVRNFKTSQSLIPVHHPVFTVVPQSCNMSA
jgi:hypothetical protein